MSGTGAFFVSIAIAAALSGCATQAPPPGGTDPDAPRNVILISVDTLRADHVGCYGYPKPTTPFIDSLAGKGVRFEHAFAQSSWTLPSHMSLMTSRYPRSHRVQADDRVLPPKVVTLAQVMQENGYTTQAFVSWVYLSAKFGFDRGFDGFEELVPPPELLDSETKHAVKAAEVVDRVIEWAGSGPGEPFLLFVHLFDPHVNYEPPLEHARAFDPDVQDLSHGSYPALRPYIKGLKPGAGRIPPDQLRRVTALYDGEIRYTDAELRRLFAALGDQRLLENTLIVLTSDHGEELDDHGSMEGHQWTLYDEITRVPLLMVFPDGAPGGLEPAGIAQSIDVAPTILSYLGLEAPEGFQGRDLMPRIRERGEPEPGDFTFSQTNRFSKKWAIRTERHKLIYTTDTGVNPFGVPVLAGYELYDLNRDPAEQRDVYDPALPEVEEMMGYLDVVVRQMRRLEGQAGPKPELSPQERERLRSLGYVDGP